MLPYLNKAPVGVRGLAQSRLYLRTRTRPKETLPMSMDDTIPPQNDDVTAGSSESDPELAAGTLLGGRYRIELRVGRGGMGVVYRATQLALDRQVAVKVLHRDLVRHGGKVQQLRSEALAASRLRHPNIVTVYDFESTPEGQVYLVMEYLPGPPLDIWLEARPWAPPSTAVAVLKPVCSAVDALHRAGIVHRDIKPSNIVLPPDEDTSDVIKIVDFGIARLAEEEGAREASGRHFVGTPEYLAPEIIDGRRADGRSDVYSLGVTAYEIVTGAPPFTGDTASAVLMAHITRDPRPPSELVPDLPPAVDEAILCALAKDPEQRYPSAVAFASALEAAFASGSRRRNTTPVNAPMPENAGPLVLVVDDEAQVSAMLRLALEGEGYAVEVANDGVEALMALGRRRFDLIVSDLDMPNLGGFELIEFKTGKGIDTPVIFVTGREGTEEEIRGFTLGAEDFIRKPMQIDVLLARVRRVIERRSSKPPRKDGVL